MAATYYFSLQLDDGRLGNVEPAQSPAELASMFMEACAMCVADGKADPDDTPAWHAFAVEYSIPRELTKVEDAALLATFEQFAGGKARWVHE